jgi:hypothetical protein
MLGHIRRRDIHSEPFQLIAGNMCEEAERFDLRLTFYELDQRGTGVVERRGELFSLGGVVNMQLHWLGGELVEMPSAHTVVQYFQVGKNLESLGHGLRVFDYHVEVFDGFFTYGGPEWFWPWLPVVNDNACVAFEVDQVVVV